MFSNISGKFQGMGAIIKSLLKDSFPVTNHNFCVISSRKKAVVFVHVGFLVTYFIMTVPVKYGRSYEALIIGRLLNGLFRGIGFSYVPIYVAEITCRTKFGFYQIPSMICMFVGAGLGLGLAHPKVNVC